MKKSIVIEINLNKIEKELTSIDIGNSIIDTLIDVNSKFDKVIEEKKCLLQKINYVEKENSNLIDIISKLKKELDSLKTENFYWN